MGKEKICMIKVSESFHKFLATEGRKEESFEEILKRLTNYDKIKVKEIEFKGRR